MNAIATDLMRRFRPGVYEIRTLTDAPVWAGLLKAEEAIFGCVRGLPAGSYLAYRENSCVDGERDSELWGELVNDGRGCVTKGEPGSPEE
jgi:hypothetical protein